MKRIKRIATILACAALAFALALGIGAAPAPIALADVGGFAGDSDYGGGDDYDDGGYGGGYGGGGYSYGGGWDDSGDDDDDDWGTTWGNDDDGWSGRNSGGSGSGSSSSSYSHEWSDEELQVLGVVFLVVIVGGIVLLVRYFGHFGHGRPKAGASRSRGAATRSAHSSRSAQPSGASRTLQSKLKSAAMLQDRDPGFSQADIEELVANLYVRMQHAWTAGDFEPMRPYFTNTLFAQLSSQLGSLRAKGQTNHVDDIAVLEVTMRGWYEAQGSEHLVLRVCTRITDYTVDDATGNVVGGFKDAESYMEYEYDLERPVGTKTPQMQAQTVVGECPNCGAPIDLAQSARCEYCGSVVESARHTWVIGKIKGISQQIKR